MMIVLITNAEGREEEHIGVVVPPLGLWEIFARLVERQDVIILYIREPTHNPRLDKCKSMIFTEIHGVKSSVAPINKVQRKF